MLRIIVACRRPTYAPHHLDSLLARRLAHKDFQKKFDATTATAPAMIVLDSHPDICNSHAVKTIRKLYFLRNLSSFAAISRGAAIALISITLGGQVASNAQIEAASGVTMGAGLSIAMEKAQEMIRKAKATGNDVSLQAGLNLQNAISATEAAYAGSLKKTIESLNDTERKAYTDIDNLLAKAVNNWADSSNQILRDAKVIANSLPFAGKFPQVAAFTPDYVTPDESAYHLAVSGNFPFASNKKRRPVLELNGKRLQAVEATTVLLRFDVPSGEFGPPSTDKLITKSAILHVPWDSSSALNPFSKVKDGVFMLQLAKLPQTPGTLIIYHEVEKTKNETGTRRSGSFNFDSHADDIEENRSLDLNDADWSAGWRIVPSTGFFILDKHNEGSEGHDWYNKGLQGQNDRSVVWRVRTEHKGFGSSGKIIWGIGARVARDVREKVQEPETISLKWGMRKIFTYPAGKWKAVWKRFDGSELEYRETYLGNAYLQLSANGDALTVMTYGQ